MGTEEKLANLSRRFVARTVHTVGHLFGNPRWEMAGHLLGAQADDDAAREKSKDDLKALEAVSRFASERPGLIDTQRIAPVATTGTMPRSHPRPSAADIA
ncbi:hypothetical protein Cme02nite_73450 [Catellatospora methionotrophica]|uniref:Uncharacterized protein n=1 Tax=Catellatospora methionotrophica TaxID=121620 RepID=A0A8J3LDE2_9ACTN|nr:hypothetical protein [Catellatospora methionotrophica]GIG19013.1 hypothetical protein Cme02nite_73450 [Catellatospora methionotrophica]